MLNHRKAAVIGCGFVGSSIAFSLIQRGLFSELVLIDRNQDKAVGEAMDLSHGLPYIAAMDVRAGSYDDLSDCALIVVTAGANQKPGQTRLELIGQNVAILNSIIPQITARPFEGILLIVSAAATMTTAAATPIPMPIFSFLFMSTSISCRMKAYPARTAGDGGKKPLCTKFWNVQIYYTHGT